MDEEAYERIGIGVVVRYALLIGTAITALIIGWGYHRWFSTIIASVVFLGSILFDGTRPDLEGRMEANDPRFLLGKFSWMSLSKLLNLFLLIYAAIVYAYADWLFLSEEGQTFGDEQPDLFVGGYTGITVMQMGLVFICIGLTGFWRLWLPWVSRKQHVTPVTVTTSILFLTVVFTGFTSKLHAGGRLTEGVHLGWSPNPWTTTWFYYMWHLFDTVPIVKIPQTLNWHTVELYGRTSGLLLLTYKVLVVIAAIKFIKELVDHRRIWSSWILRNQEITPVAVFLSFVVFTVLYSAIAGILYANDVFTEVQPNESADAWTIMLSYYLWHLCDTVPLVKIPETLNWTRPIELTDHVSGGLLLVYKVFVIIAAIKFIKDLADRRRDALANEAQYP